MAEDLATRVKEYLGDGERLSDDVWNGLAGVWTAFLDVDDPDTWGKVKAALPYAAYLRDIKCAGDTALANAIVAATKPGLVTQYDDFVTRINNAIDGRIRKRAQVEVVNHILDEAHQFIYGRPR